MMHIGHRRFWLALLAGLCGTPAQAAAQVPPEPAVVSLPADNVQFLPFYLAQDRGLFAEHGLQVKFVYLAGVGTTNGVISGSVDFGVSNGASLTRAAAHGQRLLAIALMSDRPSWSLLLRKDLAAAAGFEAEAPLAQRVRALAGKRIAVDTVNSVAHAYARVMAKEAGLDPESIAVTPLVATEAIAAFQRRAIDGLVTASPWREQLEAGGEAIPIAESLKGDPAWMTPFAAGLLITRPQFCASHPSVCMKMGQTVVAAAKAVHEQPEDALAVLKQHFSRLDPAVIERSFATVRAATAATPVVSAAAIANSDRLNREAGFIPAEEQLKDYSGLFTDEFVR